MGGLTNPPLAGATILQPFFPCRCFRPATGQTGVCPADLLRRAGALTRRLGGHSQIAREAMRKALANEAAQAASRSRAVPPSGARPYAFK